MCCASQVTSIAPQWGPRLPRAVRAKIGDRQNAIARRSRTQSELFHRAGTAVVAPVACGQRVSQRASLKHVRSVSHAELVLAIAAQWVGVIGALGGVLLTGVFAIATAILNYRAQRTSAQEDREVQRRNSKAELLRDAYTRLQTNVFTAGWILFSYTVPAGEVGDEQAVEALGAIREAHKQMFEELEGADSALQLLGSDRVRDASSAVTDALVDLLEATVRGKWSDDAMERIEGTRNALLEALRDEQAALLQ
jgi:hypothetical protein